MCRCDPDDPMFQVPFEDENLSSKKLKRTRVGHPREKWLKESLKEAFDVAKKEQIVPMEENCDPDTPEHIDIIKMMAADRVYCFQTKPDLLKPKRVIFSTANCNIPSPN